MATLKSLYSEAVVANVPSDLLSPMSAILGAVSMHQDGAVLGGRSVVTLNWTDPTKNEVCNLEFIGDADGFLQSLETHYDPIESGTYTLYERTAIGAGGQGNTILNGAHTAGSKVLTVLDTSNFAVNDYICIEDGVSGKEEYLKIASIDSGTQVTVTTGLRLNHADSSTVKECTLTVKTESEDYTVDILTGVLSLVAGKFTNGNAIVITYQTTLQDLNRIEIYRIPGVDPVSNPTYANVTGHAQVVTVDNNIAPGTQTKQDTLSASENGENWTYYIFAIDDESSENISASDSVLVETIPSIPQNLIKEVGDNKVKLDWSSLPLDSDENTNGFNIYRCEGSVFTASLAVKVNSQLINKSTTTFSDSANNTINRRPANEVPYPVNGLTYCYKLESEDTVSSWTTGTRNQSNDPSQSAQTTASKDA